MKVLLVSPDPDSRELTRLAVRGIERRLGRQVTFLEAEDGERGLRVARAERPEVVLADEIASRAGAFALAKELRAEGYGGAIVILLERRQDVWLARWSGADAWFVRPIDPFELAERVLGLIGGPRAAAEAVGTTFVTAREETG